jgi:hypothetical protein
MSKISPRWLAEHTDRLLASDGLVAGDPEDEEEEEEDDKENDEEEDTEDEDDGYSE